MYNKHYTSVAIIIIPILQIGKLQVVDVSDFKVNDFLYVYTFQLMTMRHILQVSLAQDHK